MVFPDFRIVPDVHGGHEQLVSLVTLLSNWEIIGGVQHDYYRRAARSMLWMYFPHPMH